MKVDMSPKGISGRMRVMGDLWELSIKLMRSKVAKGKAQERGRAFKIQDSIRKVLLEDWDPIGIADTAECSDEYDSYLAPVYRILVGSRSKHELVEALRRIERDEIGVEPSSADVLLPVTKKLLSLKVTLD